MVVLSSATCARLTHRLGMAADKVVAQVSICRVADF
jgi:hypothetical protein